MLNEYSAMAEDEEASTGEGEEEETIPDDLRYPKVYFVSATSDSIELRIRQSTDSRLEDVTVLAYHIQGDYTNISYEFFDKEDYPLTNFNFTITDLAPETTYTINAGGYYKGQLLFNDSDKINVTTKSLMPIPFTWSDDELAIINGHGSIHNISVDRWNELIYNINEFADCLGVKALSDDNYYDPNENISARKWNNMMSVLWNIADGYDCQSRLTPLRNKRKNDPIKASYFTTITDVLDNIVNS